MVEKIGVVSLGCFKNLIDTSEASGLTLTSNQNL
jgi:hypothetical protein